MKHIRSYWNSYYYTYVAELIAFLVPAHARMLPLSQEAVIKKGTETLFHGFSPYEYIIASDVLGYVYDITSFLEDARKALTDTGHVVITQYSALWEPVLRVASYLGIRSSIPEQNWLSVLDLKNMAHLAGFETVKSGTKMIMPIYISGISELLNRYVANLWPFSHIGLFHYLVLRKVSTVSVSRAHQPSLSIIIPARNEAGTMEAIARDLPDLGSFTELIFIEGNSTDNTYAEIERVAQVYGAKRKILYGKQGGKGKGDAVRKGFDMATGDIVTIYDADMTVPAHEIAGFYNALIGDKGDFINGSRLVYPMEEQSMRILNFFGNKFFSMAFSWILGQPLKDTLCGTKMLRRSDYELIKKGRSFFGDFDPFGDFDLLFGAAKLNLRIIDVPVHYKQRVYGETNISRWKHGWLLLKMTVFAARKLKFR
jgi:hypothetical protein